MTDRFGGALFDLSLYLRGRSSVVDDDAELVVVDEKAACDPLAIRVERHGLDREITHVSADHHANEPEQTTRNG